MPRLTTRVIRRAGVTLALLAALATGASAAPLNLVPGQPDYSQAFVNVAFSMGTFSANSVAVTDPSNNPLPFGTWDLLANITPMGELVDGLLCMDVDGDSTCDLEGTASEFGFTDAGGGTVLFEFLFDLTTDTLGYGGKAGVILVAYGLVDTNGDPLDPLDFGVDFYSEDFNSRADTFGYVPEPGSLSLLGLGALGVLAKLRRRVRG